MTIVLFNMVRAGFGESHGITIETEFLIPLFRIAADGVDNFMPDSFININQPLTGDRRKFEIAIRMVRMINVALFGLSDVDYGRVCYPDGLDDESYDLWVENNPDVMAMYKKMNCSFLQAYPIEVVQVLRTPGGDMQCTVGGVAYDLVERNG